MTRKDLRLLAYIRVSDVRGREGPGFISANEQAERVKAFATALGHTVVEVGEELDRSGGDMSRPVLEGFIRRIERGEADGIIVAKLDRFARSNRGARDALERIGRAGGELLCVDPNIDTSTATGRLVRDILFVTASWERERTGEQWLTARTRAVERGIHVTRHVPPGYQRGPQANDPATDRRLIPDGDRAEAVREAFRMAARGESNTAIAAHLTATLGNGHWVSSRIPRLLANRVYIGEARSGQGVAVNRAAHEPLVDEQTFLLAQRERYESLHRGSANVSLLSGILRCAGCSFAMKPQAASKTAKPLYRCIRESTHGVCPEPTVVVKQRIEDYVVGQFLARYSGEHAPTTADDAPTLAEAVAAEQAYRAQLDNLELRATIGDAGHDRLIANLHAQWQEKLAAAQTASAVSPKFGTVALDELVRDLQKHGRTADLRELLSSGIEAVFVRRAASRQKNLPIADRVKIVWCGAEDLELPRRGRRFEPRAVNW